MSQVRYPKPIEIATQSFLKRSEENCHREESESQDLSFWVLESDLLEEELGRSSSATVA